MQYNKEIITRIVFATIFIGFSLRVIIPILFDKFRGKTMGLSNQSDDIDYMIKRQKEILKSQYNLVSPKNNTEAGNQNKSSNKELSAIKNEISWGGTELQKDLKQKLIQAFGYQFGDAKINAFLNLIERRNYLGHLEPSNGEQINKEAINNFLASLFILLVIVDEIKEKKLNFTEKCAQKLDLKPLELALAIQLKILLSNKNANIKEERIFTSNFILSQYSDDTIITSVEKIVRMETNLWKRSISMLFEELSLYLTYAEILSPLVRPKNKFDLNTAFENFDETPSTSLETIKKKYKKLAQTYHPDKLGQLKLPKSLEKMALLKFNIIQESYQMITARK